MHVLKSSLIAAVLVVGSVVSFPAHADDREQLQTMQSFIDLMQGYYAIIEATHSVSDSAEKSAILQMQKIKEVMDEQGEKARAIGVFRNVLENSENPTIRNAAYLLLSETLKETGRADEAAKVLTEALRENVANAE